MTIYLNSVTIWRNQLCMFKANQGNATNGLLDYIRTCTQYTYTHRHLTRCVESIFQTAIKLLLELNNNSATHVCIPTPLYDYRGSVAGAAAVKAAFNLAVMRPDFSLILTRFQIYWTRDRTGPQWL